MLRRSLLSMALVGAVTGLAGLPPALAQDTTVRMWTFLNPSGTSPREVALAQIIANYEKANPGTRIVVETQAWDQMTPKFLAAHNTGSATTTIVSCPSSTPRLNNSSGTTTASRGSCSSSVLANPRPWIKPNAKVSANRHRTSGRIVFSTAV